MKSFHILSLLAALTLAGTVSAFEQPKVYDLKPNERVLIMGDSTTYDGTSHGGYVRLVDQAIQEQIPDRKAAVRSIAWPGVTLVPEHPEHWRPMVENESWKKVLTHPNAPTTVIYNLGLNDSKQGEANVPTYEKWVRKGVEDFRANKMNVILCTPTLWCGLTKTKSYAEAVRRVATEMKCPLIDLYAAHAEAYENKKSIHRDMGHLNMTGEILSASTILNAFGLKAEWKRYQLRIQLGEHMDERDNGINWSNQPCRRPNLTWKAPRANLVSITPSGSSTGRLSRRPLPPVPRSR